MGKKGKGKKQAHEDQQKHEEEVAESKQQETQNAKQNQAQQKPKIEVLQPKKVQYCPICTFPFQLCKYGKKAIDCKRFLMQIAPTKVSKYHPDQNTTDQQQDGQKKQKVQKKQQPKEPKQPKKEKTVKEKYIHIDVKKRDKKKFTSQVSGLSIFQIDSKELSKKLSKKFACSCSATDQDKILVQGDFFEDIKEILINDYKVKKKFILDNEQYKQKMGEQKQKKKEQKKRDKNVILEEPEHKQQDKPEQPQGPKYKNQIQAALADLDSDQQPKN